MNSERVMSPGREQDVEEGACRDGSTSGWLRRIGPAPIFIVLASVCVASVTSTVWSVSLYPAFVALLLGFVLVAIARGVLESVVERRTQSALLAQRRVVGRHLAEFSRAVTDPQGLAAALAGFPTALSSVLGVDGAVLYLESGEIPGVPMSGTAAARGARAPGGDDVVVVADGDERYACARTWLPLVADGAHIGRVGLGRALGEDLQEADLGLASLLCGQLALALRNAEYRTQLASQRSEIGALRERAAVDATGLLEQIQRPENFREIVGASRALRQVLAVVERMAPSEVSILVTGETGTGKELIARAVHALSPRRDGPLVTVNCPAIPGPLAESELFGHERGAFTDAVTARPGQFELADGGTVFLDEVADLPLDIQAKLLRVLQEGEVRRVGGHRPRPINVRAIAATNRDLLALVRSGRFREDLYYRLAAVEVELPPLRERHGDVPILASFFLEQAVRANGRTITGFSAEAMAALSQYAWPGNVRQLQNTVQRALLLSTGSVVGPKDLAEVTGARREEPATFGDAMRQEKRRRFLEALHQAGGNQSAAARLLGLSRSNFARMLRSLEIVLPRREERRVETPGRLHQYPSSTKLT